MWVLLHRKNSSCGMILGNSLEYCVLHNNNRDILTFVKKKQDHNTNCTFYYTYFRSVFDLLKVAEKPRRCKVEN